MSYRRSRVTWEATPNNSIRSSLHVTSNERLKCKNVNYFSQDVAISKHSWARYFRASFEKHHMQRDKRLYENYADPFSTTTCTLGLPSLTTADACAWTIRRTSVSTWLIQYYNMAPLIIEVYILAHSWIPPSPVRKRRAHASLLAPKCSIIRSCTTGNNLVAGTLDTTSSSKCESEPMREAWKHAPLHFGSELLNPHLVCQPHHARLLSIPTASKISICLQHGFAQGDDVVHGHPCVHWNGSGSALGTEEPSHQDVETQDFVLRRCHVGQVIEVGMFKLLEHITFNMSVNPLIWTHERTYRLSRLGTTH